MAKPRKSKAYIKALIIIAVLVIGSHCLLHYGMGLGFWKGQSFDEYLNRTVQAVTVIRELPEGAQDFRFQCNSLGLGATSVVAFTLANGEYDDFISAFDSEYDEQEDPNCFVGKTVSETLDYYNDYGEYVGFPKISFKYVIDDNIEDYTIMYYSEYRGAGMRIEAIAYKPDTGRVVVYSHGNN
jgi:hypothetical protein